MNSKKKFKLGFVVNIANPLNLDIDFGFTDEELKFHNLENVEYVNYNYVDGDYGDLTTGKAYRTRMEGVTVRKNYCDKNNRMQSKLLYEIVQFLDRTGGFVKYKITGVDIFNRAIVNIFDPISDKSIKNMILDEKYSPMYCNYNRLTKEKDERKK